MATACTDKPTPMTVEQCDCRRKTTWKWVVRVAVVLAFATTCLVTVFGVYIVPAMSAGYKAQNSINSHVLVQEEFEKRMDLRFDTVGQKFKTSWDHENKAAESLAKITADVQSLRDLVIAAGRPPLPDSTE